MAFFRNVYLFGLFVLGEVTRTVFLFLLIEFGDQLVDLLVQISTFLGRSRDDQRRARFIDKNGVDLIDDGEIQLSLHFVLQRKSQIVTQVVEAEFVVGRIG